MQTSSVDANQTVGATGTTGCSGLNMMESTNSDLTYDKVGLTTAMDDAVDYVMTNVVSPTDINPINTTSGGPDLQYYDGDYSSFCGKAWHGSGGSVVGTANCQATTSAACDEHHVYYDTSWTNIQGLSKQRELACHETGHVFGIQHSSHSASTCMKTNPITSTWTYSLHEVNDMIDFVW